MYSRADLRRAFTSTRCAKVADVREFLTGLRYKREELAATGVAISDEDYQDTIIHGIPRELTAFASHMLTSAHINNAGAPLEMDVLIKHLCEEADRLKTDRARGGKKEGTTDEALTATASDTGRQWR